jgi:sugar lactone lactonase YvrE
LTKILSTTVLAAGFARLEAPKWHAGAIWAPDPMDGCIYRISSDGNTVATLQIPEGPTGLTFLPNGDLVIATRGEQKLLLARGTKTSLFAELSSVAAGRVCDLTSGRDGTVYVTCFEMNIGTTGGLGSSQILAVRDDRDTEVLATNMAYPNGLAVTAGKELLVAETLGNRILTFAIDEYGRLGHRRTFANCEGISPLGICVDAEGAVWVAAARQPLFLRIRQGGAVTHRVHVPGRHGLACHIGGADGKTLYCVTDAANETAHSNHHHTRQVETTTIDVPGQCAP